MQTKWTPISMVIPKLPVDKPYLLPLSLREFGAMRKNLIQRLSYNVMPPFYKIDYAERQSQRQGYQPSTSGDN